MGLSLLGTAFIPQWIAAAPLPAQQWSAQAANAILAAGQLPSAGSWDTETGLRLQALDAEWYNTARGDYFNYARQTVDTVLADPNWNTAHRSPYADALLGQQLMTLYRVTLKPHYYAAARELRNRLAPSCGLETDPPETPRSSPSPEAQRPCVAQAFLAEYAAEFQRPQDFPVLAQSDANHAAHNRVALPNRDTTAHSPIFAMAWSAASLVDSLSCYPEAGPSRAQALAALRRIAAQWLRYRDSRSAHLRAASGRPASSPTDWLFIYALLKGARLGYLPPAYRTHAMRTWRNQLSAVRILSGGHIDLAGPDGEAASLGPFLLASTEVDLAPGSSAGLGSVVLLDAWFNSQQRKNAAGQLESFHYKWTDFSDSGCSLFGHMLRSAGLATQTLPVAPTAENLSRAGYYLIVSPDIPAKNPNPHYMTVADADVVAAWVRRGGVLILMENDPPNADIEHLDLLAGRFGIHFDNVLHHHILDDRVENGTIPIAAGGPLFQHPHTIYMKDTCAISLHGSAVALLRDRGDVVMATARYGRGTVFAAVDPWLYNEYTDGRKTPPALYSRFDNFAAGRELVRWLIQQRPRPLAPEKHEAKP